MKFRPAAQLPFDDLAGIGGRDVSRDGHAGVIGHVARAVERRQRVARGRLERGGGRRDARRRMCAVDDAVEQFSGEESGIRALLRQLRAHPLLVARKLLLRE